MKQLLFFFILIVSFKVSAAKKCTVLIEAENFIDKGGWVVDQQSMDVMGSPYLMAHGNGVTVKNASTDITFPIVGNHFFCELSCQ